MLAGDPTRRTLDISDPAQDAIRYVCLGGNLEETHGMSPIIDLIRFWLTIESSPLHTALLVYELKPISLTAGTYMIF
jgi:hypothetical protein